MTNRLITPEADRLPQNSVDWHFLLPLQPQSKILVVGRNSEDTIRYFTEIGIESIAWNRDLPEAAMPDFPESHFDVVAIPQGFSIQGFAHNSVLFKGFFKLARRLLKPGGFILLGFENFIAPRRKIALRGFFATPGYITGLLNKSGYENVRLYGVLSNLFTPDYIFPLEQQLVGFVLDQKIRNKLPAFLAPLLRFPLLRKLFAGCFANYFVIGVSPQ